MEAGTLEDTKVTLHTARGSAETTLGGLEEAAARALGRAQLTLEVGGDRPIGASLKISGSLPTRELRKGADVRGQVLDGNGEIISEHEAYVAQVAFVEHRPEVGSPWTERVHTIKVA